MRLMPYLFLIALFLLFAGCGAKSTMTPPDAEQRPHVHTEHGVERPDPYYWMRDRNDPAVIAYLNAENEYHAHRMAPVRQLEETIFNEIVGRIKQDDASVPYFDNGFYYYTRFEEGKEYPIYARRAGSMEAPEQVILDANVLAEGQSYFQIGGFSVSDDGNRLAYSVDTVGRRKYRLHVKDLTTGEVEPTSIFPMTGGVVWASDNETVFFTRQDEQTLRAFQVYRHRWGNDPNAISLVYEEADETFATGITRSSSREYLMIGSNQTLSTEWRILEANNPTGTFRVFEPRMRDHLYSIDHAGGYFYIQTDVDGAPNGKLMRTRPNATARANWEVVIDHRADVFLEGFRLFKDFLVVEERENGLGRLRIRNWTSGDEHYVAMDEPTYTIGIGTNRTFDTPILQYRYTSLTTPWTTFAYDMGTRERTTLKVEPVLGDFDSANYTTERHFAEARDGTRVPISLVYHNNTPRDGSAPLLLYAYGSYGYSTDATFSIPRLSLLDRGFVYAIAHVRGGQEMGRQWYEDGKLLNKKNTFTDFIDVAEYLVANNFTNPSKLYASGGSAGGLLMGAVLNMRPDLFDGVLAGVPFVDVVTTMFDASIPLTTFEWDEWGNPADKTYFDYMLSYSPYDQVEAKDYPAIMVTSGLHDSQVQYFEPTKWVARLRDMKTDDRMLVLRTNMDAGHGGASGRFQRFRETANEYAFFIGLADRTLR